MGRILPLAAITFKEGIRNRAVYGISLIALFMLVVNFLIAQMIMREVGKVAVDIALSAVSFSSLLLVLFVGINLISKDLDRKTIYMVLAKPISRGQYIWGKFLGIIELIISANLVMGFFAAISLFALKIIYPGYFQRFSWSMVIVALLLITIMMILLSSLSILFASLSSTSFVTLVLTIVAYIIGISLSDVKALVEGPQAAGIQVSPLTVKIVQVAYYIFPNLSLFDIKTQAAHGISISASYILGTISYGFIYTCIVITVAGLIFSKREFP